MKNISLILTIVLLVAVAVLFYFQFSGPTNSGTTGSGSTGPIAIAYVQTDSILEKYDFVADRNKALEAKGQRLKNDLESRINGLQNEILAYQRNVNSMTIGQVKATEEDLGRKQQNLQLYEQSLNQEVYKDQAMVSKELYDKLTRYLAKYAKEKGIQVILKSDPSSDVLFIGQGLDITADVIAGLNEEYKLEKAGAKPDTTKVK